MKIDYKITEYFEKNNMMDDTTSNGIIIHNNESELLVEGSTRDLVELADLIVNVAASKIKGTHVHIDQNTLLNESSNIKEIIIQKNRG